MRLLLASTLALAAAACTDFATPQQLESATIIAVVADPPLVAPGDQARLTIVVADQTGVLTLPPATWQLGEAFPGVAPMGTVTGDATGATYTAPATVPPRPDSVPPLDSIEVSVETPDGPRTAIKAMPVVPGAAANPAITALAVGADDAMAGTVIVAKGDTRMLSVTTDPPMDAETTRYAWYTSVGTIKYYQSNPCELVVDQDAASGPLIVVVRDGVGGVVWRSVTLQVE